MAVDVTIYPQSITWNGLTWNSAEGGPLVLRYQHEGEEVESRTGADEYSRQTFIVNKKLRVFVGLAELKQTSSPGTKGDMVATMTTKAGTSPINFPDMILVGLNGSGARATTSEVELVFTHESDDGTTNPIT